MKKVTKKTTIGEALEMNPSVEAVLTGDSSKIRSDFGQSGFFDLFFR